MSLKFQLHNVYILQPWREMCCAGFCS